MKSLARKLLESFEKANIRPKKRISENHRKFGRRKVNENVPWSKLPNGDIKYVDPDYGELIFRPMNPERNADDPDWIISYWDCLNWYQLGYDGEAPLLHIDWDIDGEYFDDMMTVNDTKHWEIADAELIFE